MKNNEILLFPNALYHIYTHANGKENLFECPENYIFFLKRYQYFVQPIAETFAYCLMPNHLHLMLRIKNQQELQEAHKNFRLDKKFSSTLISDIEEENLPKFISKTFGNLFSSYTQAFNKQQKRKGSLFIPNFKRKEVNDEQYYTKLIYYIHNNPVHHGFVEKMEDWFFSSFNAYISAKETKIAKEEVLHWFGNEQAFREYHKKEKVDFSFDI